MSVADLEPDLLRAFVAVAEQRSFTRAAAMLSRTQSAVSMQIKRLEDRLGVRAVQPDQGECGFEPGGRRPAGLREANSLAERRGRRQAGRAQNRRRGAARGDGRLRLHHRSTLAGELPRWLSADPYRDGNLGLTSSMPARLGGAYDLVIAMHPERRGEVRIPAPAACACWQPVLLRRSNSRNRCQWRSIRKAVRLENGRSRRSTRPTPPGGSLS